MKTEFYLNVDLATYSTNLAIPERWIYYTSDVRGAKEQRQAALENHDVVLVESYDGMGYTIYFNSLDSMNLFQINHL